MNDMKVEIKTVGDHQIMSSHKFVPKNFDDGDLWAIMFEQYQEKGVKASTPMFAMTKYHNWDRNSDNFDIEVMSYVDGDYENNEDVTFYYLPETFIAQTTYKGNYDLMPDVIDQLKEWVENNDYIDLGNVYKIAVVAPGHGEDNPDNFITTIGIEVQKEL